MLSHAFSQMTLTGIGKVLWRSHAVPSTGHNVRHPCFWSMPFLQGSFLGSAEQTHPSTSRGADRWEHGTQGSKTPRESVPADPPSERLGQGGEFWKSKCNSTSFSST